jgi:hypothetical protein
MTAKALPKSWGCGLLWTWMESAESMDSRSSSGWFQTLMYMGTPSMRVLISPRDGSIPCRG